MDRLQILIDPELNRALASEARRKGTSKGALIRAYVRERLKPLPPIEEDPIWDIVGMSDAEPVEDIDEVIYGGKTRDRP